MTVQIEKFSAPVWKSTLQTSSWQCLKNSVHDIFFPGKCAWNQLGVKMLRYTTKINMTLTLQPINLAYFKHYSAYHLAISAC